MKNLINFLWIAIFGFIVFSCSDPIASISLEISGPCEECPSSRIDSLLKKLDGVQEVNVDKDGLNAEVTFDSTIVSANDIRIYLTKYGYDVDLFTSEAMAVYPPCCKVGFLEEDDMEDNETGEEFEEAMDELSMDLAYFDLDKYENMSEDEIGEDPDELDKLEADLMDEDIDAGTNIDDVIK